MAAVTERLLTAREVGDVLGFSTETILRWHRAGKLPAVRTPGGAIRFQPSAIEAKLTEWSTAASPSSDGVLTRLVTHD